MYENDREKFFENGGISFIVVRDPFERLVSAYLVTIMINVFTFLHYILRIKCLKHISMGPLNGYPLGKYKLT